MVEGNGIHHHYYFLKLHHERKGSKSPLPRRPNRMRRILGSENKADQHQRRNGNVRSYGYIKLEHVQMQQRKPGNYNSTF